MTDTRARDLHPEAIRSWPLLLATSLLLGPTAVSSSASGAQVFDPRGLTRDRFAVPSATEGYVTAHDGTQLFTRVYRPDTSAEPKWRTPVVLVDSPYFHAPYKGVPPNTAPVEYQQDMVRFLTPKGYTVVLADVRGTGYSGGCLEQDGPDQARDVVDLVDHFAAQPWSDGRVGGHGLSYDAEALMAGAVLAPKALKTLVVAGMISSLQDQSQFDGVPYRTNGPLGAAIYHDISSSPPSDPTRRPTWLVDRQGCQPDQYVGQSEPSGDETPYWRARDFRPRVGTLRATVLDVQGFADTNVYPINLDGFVDRIPTMRRLVLGQWIHRWPQRTNPYLSSPSTGSAGPRYGRGDWFDMVHAWYDSQLLGLPTHPEGWPAVQVQDGDGDWHPARSYADLTQVRRVPLGIGTLGQAGATGSVVSFPETGTADFVSAPLPEELRLSGQFHVDLLMSTDKPDGHLTARFYAQSPDGSRTQLSRGHLSLPHAGHLGRQEPVPTDEPRRYRLRSMPLDVAVRAGQRLVVELSGDDPDMLPAGTGWTGTVSVGGGSFLELPVARDRGLLRVR